MTDRRSRSRSSSGLSFRVGRRTGVPGSMLHVIPNTTREALLTRLGVLDVEFPQRAGNDEISVVEHQRPRNTVLEQLKRHRIDRRLLAVRGLGVAVVITHRDRPPRQRFHYVVCGRWV